MGARPSILTEPFFGSNASDAATAAARKDELAAAQAGAAINLLKSMDVEDIWTVRASVLNVRGGPGVEFDTLDWGPLANGAKVEVISRSGDWAFVRAEKGEGFVHGAFLI
jgi:SH3-like domain-containing protein